MCLVKKRVRKRENPNQTQTSPVTQTWPAAFLHPARPSQSAQLAPIPDALRFGPRRALRTPDMRVPHVSLTSPVPLADHSVPLVSTSPFSFPAPSTLCSTSPDPRCPVDLRDPRRPTGQPRPGLPEASLSLGSRRAVGMIRFHRAAPVILAGLPFGARTPKTPAASFNWHRRTPCASTTPHRNH